MGRGFLSEEEVNQLKENVYVNDVDETRIFYTTEFKVLFIKEYLAGKKPKQIFREAGFDVKMLGDKRIERATARWRELYEANGFEAFEEEQNRAVRRSKKNVIEEQYKSASSRLKLCEKQLKNDEKKIKSMQEEIDELKNLIANLYQENVRLREKCNDMRYENAAVN